MRKEYLLVIFLGFFLGLVSIVALKKFAQKRKILITKGIPLVGGLGMGVSFVVCAFYGLSQGLSQGRGFSQETWGIILASWVMLTLGFIDDWRELSIRAKFFVQVLATSLLILFGIRTYIAYIGTPLNILITFVWVLGITNALNHLDILDGLAAGTALCICLAFFSISFINNQANPALLSLALVGALAGFFVFNFPPAKVYMGNSGSHFLGFLLSAIALMISYAPLERKIALLSPLVILGVPILDTGFLVFMRLDKRILPFKKSNDHLALRLLSLGYSKKNTLCVLLAGAALFSLGGVVVSQVSNPAGLAIVAFMVTASLVFLVRVSKAEKK